MKAINLNELRDKAHKNAVEKGFWEEERPIASYLMLVICEIAEAVEADRRGFWANRSRFDYGIQCCEEDFSETFSRDIKDHVEDELADVAIRLLDLAGKFNVDITLPCPQSDNDYSGLSFCECAYRFIDNMMTYYRPNKERGLRLYIAETFNIAERFNIDLLWHIEQKMKYNESRGRRHGKEY